MDEVIDLLHAWGLPELSASFIKNEINIQSLAALSCEEIKELIPQVGPRALFSRCWKMWRTDFLSNSLNISTAADMNSCNISLSVSVTKTVPQPGGSTPAYEAKKKNISVITTEDQQVEQERQSLNVTRSSNEHVHEQVQPVAINLEGPSISTGCTDNLYFSYDSVEDNILFILLKENFETLSLVNFVGKALENDSARNLLASIICKQILKENKNLPITSVIYNKWTKEIKTIFPKERITTYYIPPCVTAQGVTHQARGKLVSQLLNIRRKYQKLGVLEVKEKRHPIPQSSNQVAPSLRPLPRVNAQQNNNINEDFAWLRSSSEPWTLVELKWNDTLEKRSDDLRKTNHSIEQYFDEYPVLIKPMGYKLLVSDFENNYPEYMNNLYLNFPAVKNTL